MLRQLTFLLVCAFGPACAPSSPPPPTGAMGADRTLFANIRAADNLAAFSEALGAAGLAETLSRPGTYTVFAPTDAAFAALPDEFRNLLARRGSPELGNLLAYHLVPSQLLAADFAGNVRSINGAPLLLALEDSVVTVNGHPLILRDVPARNGVLHVIDVVLQPPGALD